MPGRPPEHIYGPASVGRSGGQATVGATGARGSGGCTSRRDRSCQSTAVTVCGSGPRNRHRLGSRPGRQPARGVRTRGFAEEQSGKGPVRMLAQLHPCTHRPTNPDGISTGSPWHRATMAQGTVGSQECLTILPSHKWDPHGTASWGPQWSRLSKPRQTTRGGMLSIPPASSL